LYVDPFPLTFDESVHFVSIGDWGLDLDTRNDDGPRGDWAVDILKSLSLEMKRKMEALSSACVINLGDSFYQFGINSVHDVRWKTTFENVFPYCRSTPWYGTLGNHDYKGNLLNPVVTYDQGITAEIFRTLHPDNQRWCMPNNNYTVHMVGNEFDVYVVVFDSQAIVRLDPDDDGATTAYKGRHAPKAESQIHWLKSHLCSLRNRKKPSWIFTASHHFITSGGTYFPELRTTKLRIMEDRIEPILFECGVHAHFHGHEHLTQVFELQQNTQKILQFGLGSAGKLNGVVDSTQADFDRVFGPNRRKMRKLLKDAAFGSFQVSKNRLDYEIIDSHGQILMKDSINKQ